MTCCGKSKQITGKAKNIVKGLTALARGKKYEFTDGRIRICRSCEFNTWLTKVEYSTWLLKHGIKVLTNFDDLTKLPMLPKKTGAKTIYCRHCKCNIPAKARVKEMKCPLDKWLN
jgi:hypothetical protein